MKGIFSTGCTLIENRYNLKVQHKLTVSNNNNNNNEQICVRVYAIVKHLKFRLQREKIMLIMCFSPISSHDILPSSFFFLIIISFRVLVFK